MINQHNPYVADTRRFVSRQKDKLGNVEKQPGNVGKPPSSVKPSLIRWYLANENSHRYPETT